MNITTNNRSAVPPLHQEVPGESTPGSRHILVVDDDAVIRELLTRILRRAGYRVSCAADGEAGWEALCTENFDALITDQEMPRLTGLNLLRRMRAGTLTTIPAILISGRMPWSATDLPRLIAPGMALEKPFSLGDFLEKVREMLNPTNHPNDTGARPVTHDSFCDRAPMAGIPNVCGESPERRLATG